MAPRAAHWCAGFSFALALRRRKRLTRHQHDWSDDLLRLLTRMHMVSWSRSSTSIAQSDTKLLEDRFFETTDPEELVYALPRDDTGAPSFVVKLEMPWGTESWVNPLATYSADLFCCRFVIEDSWENGQDGPQARRTYTFYGHGLDRAAAHRVFAQSYTDKERGKGNNLDASRKAIAALQKDLFREFGVPMQQLKSASGLADYGASEMLNRRRQDFATSCLAGELQPKEKGGPVVRTGKKGEAVSRAVAPTRKRQRDEEEGEEEQEVKRPQASFRGITIGPRLDALDLGPLTRLNIKQLRKDGYIITKGSDIKGVENTIPFDPRTYEREHPTVLENKFYRRHGPAPWFETSPRSPDQWKELQAIGDELPNGAKIRGPHFDGGFFISHLDYGYANTGHNEVEVYRWTPIFNGYLRDSPYVQDWAARPGVECNLVGSVDGLGYAKYDILRLNNLYRERNRDRGVENWDRDIFFVILIDAEPFTSVHSKLWWGMGYYRPVLLSSVKSANYGSSGMSATAEPGKPAPARTSRETGDWNCYPLGSAPADDMLDARQAHFVSDMSKGIVFENDIHAFTNPFVPVEKLEEEKEAYAAEMSRLRQARRTVKDLRTRTTSSTLIESLDLSLSSRPALIQPSSEVAQVLRTKGRSSKDDKVCLPGVGVCSCGYQRRCTITIACADSNLGFDFKISHETGMEAFCRVQFGPAQGAFLSDIRMVQDPTLLARTLEAFKSMAIIYNNEKVPGIIVCWYESLREDLIGLNKITTSLKLWMSKQAVLRGIDTARAIAELASQSDRRSFATLVSTTLGPKVYIAKNLQQGTSENHGWKARRCRRGQQDISSSSRIEAQEDSWEGEGGGAPRSEEDVVMAGVSEDEGGEAEEEEEEGGEESEDGDGDGVDLAEMQERKDGQGDESSEESGDGEDYDGSP
ncbi:hypothetical protein BCR35DRAFT_327197 [Leucosporidium creatinivorum]|uniref:Uncharacterized protein n=1 Tax=Leucosporidium creatinivorum TaxID=106004 RepID=A0A1Y2D0Q5_9BASI|nr:hypothetical protein BCR35DRAFT_327197 [Leucosporidium creatinivorum]